MHTFSIRNFQIYRIYKKMPTIWGSMLGPWGAPSDGAKWIFVTNGGRITSITLSSQGTSGDLAVSSLECTWTDKDGKVYHSGLYGTVHNDVQTYSFADDEEVVEVRGTFGYWAGMLVITSLTFKTNKKEYGPYGSENGNHFSAPIENGKLGGLLGTSGDVIDSFGVVITPD